jgi:hypothetical protein
VPTINAKNVDGERPGGGDGDPRESIIYVKTSTAGPLGGGDGDPGAPTINTKTIDDGPPAGGGGVTEIQERLLPTQKMSTTAPGGQ